jgi:hypothetical protein
VYTCRALIPRCAAQDPLRRVDAALALTGRRSLDGSTGTPSPAHPSTAAFGPTTRRVQLVHTSSHERSGGEVVVSPASLGVGHSTPSHATLGYSGKALAVKSSPLVPTSTVSARHGGHGVTVPATSASGAAGASSHAALAPSASSSSRSGIPRLSRSTASPRNDSGANVNQSGHEQQLQHGGAAQRAKQMSYASLSQRLGGPIPGLAHSQGHGVQAPPAGGDRDSSLASLFTLHHSDAVDGDAVGRRGPEFDHSMNGEDFDEAVEDGDGDIGVVVVGNANGGADAFDDVDISEDVRAVPVECCSRAAVARVAVSPRARLFCASPAAVSAPASTRVVLCNCDGAGPLPAVVRAGRCRRSVTTVDVCSVAV